MAEPPPEKRPRTDAAPRVAIVGGGIGGCVAAIALAQAGADVTVYEAAARLLEIGAGINVQAVAIGVLGRLGIPEERLKDPVLGDGIETSKVEYYTIDGLLVADEPVGRAKGDTYPQFSLHRAKFHTTLLAKARETLGEDRVLLDHSFVGMDRADDGTVTVHFARRDGARVPPVVCDFLVGADGLKSRVRANLLGDGLPRYTGKTIYRGLCEVDALISDGTTVSLCGNADGVFICYPISEGLRAGGRTHCNWGFAVTRPEPGGVESWTSSANVSVLRDELAALGQNAFGGLTPLQMAERTETIISWALFDRDPLESFDFGTVTLLGDAAHPLLPYGSQGATQAIMDAEALGEAYKKAAADGTGVRGAVKLYSDMRCAASGRVVIANRDMGSTAVLREVEKKCAGMSREEKADWIGSHGRQFFSDVIQAYRASMPTSIAQAPAGK